MKSNYLSFLLRVWQAGSAESPKLVASLEDPHTHQVIHFGNLDALMRYLLQNTHCWGINPTSDGEQEKTTD